MITGPPGVAAVAAAAVTAVVLVGVGAHAALAAGTDPGPRCDVVEAHLQLSADPERPQLAVSGFPNGSCDGAAALLVVTGNPAGDPSAAVTETLGSYDSRLDPCTQQTLRSAGVITGGSIVFAGCADGGPAGRIDLHDATRFTVRLRAVQDVAPGPAGPTPDQQHRGSASTNERGAGLPGGWATLAAVGGTGAAAAGIAGRRRHARRVAT